jgi:DNA-binding XRE family transcriptional regulator
MGGDSMTKRTKRTKRTKQANIAKQIDNKALFKKPNNTANKVSTKKRKIRPKTLIFKSKVREYRKKHGMSTEELANKLGICINTVYNWEKKGVFPREATRIHMLKVLGCTFDDLFYEVSS